MDLKNILLVEDNPDDIELTIRSMKKAAFDHELVIAHDGEEALDILENCRQAGHEAEYPSLILLDLKLPGISGLDVLKRIRSDEATFFIPVVVLTTSREDIDIETSYRLGANSYIQKPVDFTRFTEVVSQLGKYWLLFNETPLSR